MKVGDRIRFTAEDCCLGVSGEGIVEKVETVGEAWAREAPGEDLPNEDERDDIVAFTVGGVEVRHPWGDVSYWEIETLT